MFSPPYLCVRGELFTRYTILFALPQAPRIYLTDNLKYLPDSSCYLPDTRFYLHFRKLPEFI